jgi:hypothetical protein
MKDIFITPPSKIEVRCDGFHALNNLSATDPMQKYSVIIDRVADPQDADGQRAGKITRLDPVRLSLADVWGEAVEVEGHTIPVPVLLAAINAFIDSHKGDNL